MLVAQPHEMGGGMRDEDKRLARIGLVAMKQWR